MTEPPSPPVRLQSQRRRLLRFLSTEPMSARELSHAAGLSERDVYDHLQHLRKTLRKQACQLIVSPAACLDCHYTFRKRERLTRPGKCPICRSTHLSEPHFCLAGSQ
ncbi:MAG: ArsR family transcriptional regulator [Desulfuromonadales bacterium]